MAKKNRGEITELRKVGLRRFLPRVSPWETTQNFMTEICDLCEDMGCVDCKHCVWGNPCLGCTDYDEARDICTSDGACASTAREKEEIEDDRRFSKHS